MSDSLLTVQQVMERLNLGKSSIYKLKDTGTLPCVYVNSSVRWKESTLQAFIEKLGDTSER